MAATLLLLILPLLSGCLRARMSIGVSGDDRVTGEIIVATLDAAQAPALRTPPAVANRVSVRPYDQDGYVGSQVFFSDLSFAELQQLSTLTSDGANQYHLALRRDGDTVSLDGAVNLTTLRADGADVQLRINFPGNVTSTNGVRDGDSGVHWQLPAGESSVLQAKARYADPGTRYYQSWLLFVVFMVLAASALVVVMARRARDHSTRSGARSG